MHYAYRQSGTELTLSKFRDPRKPFVVLLKDLTINLEWSHVRIPTRQVT